MRQEDFAQKMGVSRKTVIRYESDASSPDADFLRTLVMSFGVDPAWLLMGTGAGRIELPPREAMLLDLFRRCPERARDTVLDVADMLAQSGAEKK